MFTLNVTVNTTTDDSPIDEVCIILLNTVEQVKDGRTDGLVRDRNGTAVGFFGWSERNGNKAPKNEDDDRQHDLDNN